MAYSLDIILLILNIILYRQFQSYASDNELMTSLLPQHGLCGKLKNTFIRSDLALLYQTEMKPDTLIRSSTDNKLHELVTLKSHSIYLSFSSYNPEYIS